MKKRIGWVLLVVTFLVSSMAMAADRESINKNEANRIWNACIKNNRVKMKYFNTNSGKMQTGYKTCHNLCVVFIEGNTTYKKILQIIKKGKYEYTAAKPYNDISLKSNYKKPTILITGMTNQHCDALQGQLKTGNFTLNYKAVMKSTNTFNTKLNVYSSGCATKNALPAGLVIVNNFHGAYTIFTNYPKCEQVYKLFEKYTGNRFEDFDDSEFKAI